MALRRYGISGLVLIVACALGAGCQLIFRVRAEKLVVVTWFEAPAIAIPGLPAQDRVVTATAVFLDRKGGFDPQPVSGGFAGFFGAGKLFPMRERDPGGAPGVYTVSSLEPEADSPPLPYDSDENRRYGFKACAVNRGDGCVGEEFMITRIRAAVAIDPTTLVFDPALGTSNFPGFSGLAKAGDPLTVRFPAPSDDAEYRPVLNVLGPAGDPAAPLTLLYSSIPTEAPKLIEFLTTAPELDLVIPGDKLALDGIYVVLAGSARLSLDTSDNLFLGSGAIAGSLNAFIVEVSSGTPPQSGGIPSIPFP